MLESIWSRSLPAKQFHIETTRFFAETDQGAMIHGKCLKPLGLLIGYYF